MNYFCSALLSFVGCVAVVYGSDVDIGLLRSNPNAASNEGTEFVLGFFSNNEQTDTSNVGFFISTNDPNGAVVDISVPLNSNFPTRRVMVQPGETQSVSFDTSIRVGSDSPVDGSKGIRVTSSALITVQGQNDAGFSTDSFLALPCQRFTTTQYKYLVLTTSTDSSSTTTVLPSRFLMVPCEADTTISYERPGQGLTTVNSPVQYQTIVVSDQSDLTGTIINANKPIAVFVGHQCGQIPTSAGTCDHLVEQVPSFASYGRTFFALPFALRESGDIFKVGSIIENTVNVTCTRRTSSGGMSVISRAVSERIAPGSAFEFRTFFRDQQAGLDGDDFRRDFCCIETSAPASVMQFSLGHSQDEINNMGDPAISYVPPISQYKKSMIVSDASFRPIFDSYISWAVPVQFFDPSVDSNSFTFNGEPFTPQSMLDEGSGGYIPISCSNGEICGYGAFSRLSRGVTGTLEYSSDKDPEAAAFAQVYGFGQEISYAYPAGYQLEPIGLPHVTVFDIIVNEGDGLVTVPFERTGGDLTVPTRIFARTVVSVVGQAQEGTDFMPVSDVRIRWAPGERLSGRGDSFQFMIVDDDIGESTEYLEIAFDISSTGFAYPRAVGRVTILDDDMPGQGQCTLDPASYVVSEQTGFIDVTVTTNDAAIVGSSCRISTSTGTAGAADFTGHTNTIVSFGSSNTATVRIFINNDDIVESTERFFVTLSSSDSMVTIPQSTATVDITDSDVVTLQFDPTSYQVNEVDGNARLRIVKQGRINRDIVFTFETQDGTASSASDYSSVTRTLTFPSADSEFFVDVPITNDNLFENTESFTAKIDQSTPDSDVSIPDATSVATVMILNDDLDLIVQFDQTIYTVMEGVPAQLMLRLSMASSQQVTVELNTRDDSATVSGGDYSLTSTTVTFQPGQTLVPFPINTGGDNINELTERFFATLSNPSGAMLGANTEATISITEPALTVGFTPTVYTVNEGMQTVFTVTLSSVADRAVEVNFNTEDDTAEATTNDYNSLSTTITFPAGQTSRTVTVNTNTDSLVEGNERFFGSLSNPTNGLTVRSAQDTATVNIVDSNAAVVTFDPTSYIVTEGGQAMLRLTLSNPSDMEITVQVVTREGSATNPEDYTLGTTTVTFAPRQTTATLPVSTVNDDISELNEIFTAVLMNPSGAIVGADDTANIQIVDNDPAVVTFDPTSYTVTEGGQVTLELTLSNPSDMEVTVNVVTREGSATNPRDYTFETTTVTFAARQITATVPVGTVDDDISELNEVFTAVLMNPSGATVGTDDTATIQIIDNDPLIVQFQPGRYDVIEGGVVAITAVLNREADYDVEVTITTRDVIATNPEDYFFIPRVVTFPAGETSMVITVQTNSDNVVDDGETFEAIISNPSDGLEIGSMDVATVTIMELNVGFDPNSYVVTEGEMAMLTIVLNRAFDMTITVDLVTNPGSATAEDDYMSVTTTVTFLAGDTVVMVPVEIIDDDVNELNEIFRAVLVNPVGGAVITSSLAEVQIIDNDPLSLGFEDIMYTTDEGNPAVLIIRSNITADRPITVDFTTSDMTAEAPGDYMPVSRTVTILAGDDSVSVEVGTVDDTLDELMEAFTATLTNPGAGAVIGENETAEVVINDNDVVTIGFERPRYEVNEDDSTTQEVCAVVVGAVQLAPGRSVEVTLTSTDGTATSPSDFNSQIMVLTFESGDTRRCVDFSIREDGVIEGMEEFTVNLETDDMVQLVPDTATVEILDSDSLSISIEQPDYSVDEDGTSVEVCAVLTGGTADETIRANVRTMEISPSADAQAGSDFQQTVGVFEFLAGATRDCITIPIVDDEIAETPEEVFNVVIELQPTTANINTGRITSRVTVVDDDSVTIEIVEADYRVREDENSVEVCAVLSNAADETIRVTIVTRENNPSDAQDVSDFRQSSATLEFSPGVTERCLTIPIVDDDVAETLEEVFNVLIVPQPSTVDVIPGRTTSTVIIVDEDSPTLTIEEEDYRVTEDGTSIEVCATLSNAADETITATVRTEEISSSEAQEGSDFTRTSGTFVFTPGMTRRCITIPIEDDDIVETPEEIFNVIVELQPPPSVNVNTGTTTTTVTIVDDDTTTVSVGTVNYRVTEGEGSIEVCATLTNPLDESLSVNLRTGVISPSEAQEVSDFVETSTTLVFSPGQTERCTTIPIVDDSVVETQEESFNVVITIPTPSNNNVELGTSTSTVTITDNDSLSFKITTDTSNVVVDEDDGTVRICVERVGESADPITVTLTAVERSTADATNGMDFEESTTTVVIPPNQSIACANFVIIDDPVGLEGDEIFEVILTTPGGVPTSNPSTAIVTIRDNDDIELMFTTPNVTVNEDIPSGTTMVCFIPNRASAMDYTVVLSSTQEGINPATPTQDYMINMNDLTVTIPAGDPTEMCIEVVIVNDDTALEGPETFEFVFTGLPPNVGPGPMNPTAEVTIVDDEGDVVVTFVSPDVQVNENNGTVYVCVMRSPVTQSEMSVDILVESGTATDVNDINIDGTVKSIVFKPFENMSCVEVPVVNDNTEENNEVFSVSFAEAAPGSGVTVGANSMSTVTIVDDDRVSSVCIISNPLTVSPFNSTAANSYSFTGTCELVVLQSCSGAQSDFSVRVDFLTDTGATGAVGVFKDGLSWISRENGMVIPSSEAVQTVFVNQNATLRRNVLEVRDNIMVTVIHNYGDGTFSINVGAGSALLETCGICGTQSGMLRHLDGTVATTLGERQAFVESFRVPAREQTLRPQRTECGIVRNDTIIGDPLYAIPILSGGDEALSICFEVHGESDRIFNLVSDRCVSVNAFYSGIGDGLNIITSIAIRAVGDSGALYNAQVDLVDDMCRASYGTDQEGLTSLDDSDMINSDGVFLKTYPRRVRVSVPNCDQIRLVFWIICENRNDINMIQFRVARGINLRPTSHGIIGQFWNIRIDAQRMGDESSRNYNVTVMPEDNSRPSPPRSFLGERYSRKWNNDRETCLYAGNIQGGPAFESLELNMQGSVIEGGYKNYMVGSLFDTDFDFSQWNPNGGGS